MTVGGQASSVLLQPSLSQCVLGATSENTGNEPIALAFDPAGNLFVSDLMNNRVLKFPGAATSNSNNMKATSVFGQPDFTSNKKGSALNELDFPVGLCFDATRNILWVADTHNNRVLGFIMKDNTSSITLFLLLV